MKSKTSLLILGLATTGFALSPALAQDTLESEDSKPIVPEAFISEPVFNEIELGIGFVTDDAYKFGRYDGLETEGAYFLGAIDAETHFYDGGLIRIHGTNLGLESRYLRFEMGTQGSYKFFLEYDELPNYKDNTVVTPFYGVGSNNLTLPSGFIIDFDLYQDGVLKNFELKTKRERLAVGASFIPKDRWQFDIDFSHEEKTGVDATGAAIADSTPSLGDINISLLPEPIDFKTDMLNATLRYDGDDGQFDISYHMSLFDAGDEFLKWEDPFDPETGIGSMSLAPDNEFHQISLAGAYALPYNSRLTGLISMGRMTQNQAFQPYTINTSLVSGALPRNSLDGEVWLTTAQLKLTSRPVPALRLNAQLRYNERSNQTPITSYNYIIMDGRNGTEPDNNPYSYKNNTINLNANYRFNALSSLRAGYKYDGMKRSYSNAERTDTEENTLFAKWKIKPLSNVDLALYAEASSRDGSDYSPATNGTLRRFHLADRDRTQIGAKVDYMATDKLFLSLRGDFNRDDYNNTDIGLVEAIQPVYTFDFTYQPANNISTYGYYTYERIESSQASFEGTLTTTSGWTADFDDIFNTIGLGITVNDLGKWDIGLDAVYSESTGKMNITLLNGGEEQFPDNLTELTSVKLWTSYDYDKQSTYKLGVGFEEYSVTNWAIDGLPPYNSLTDANILLLGNKALDYSTYVVTVSYNYKF
ncbi:MtrB/PioB family decaheme-associated outer membrane protein [Pseudomonadota bacterium]